MICNPHLRFIRTFNTGRWSYVKAISNLRHPNLVLILGVAVQVSRAVIFNPFVHASMIAEFFQAPNVHCVVMEHVEQGSLEKSVH